MRTRSRRPGPRPRRIPVEDEYGHEVSHTYEVIRPENDVWRWACWDEYTSYGGHRDTPEQAQKAINKAREKLQAAALKHRRALCMGRLPGRKSKAIWIESDLGDTGCNIEPLAYFVNESAYDSFKALIGQSGLVQLPSEVDRIA